MTASIKDMQEGSLLSLSTCSCSFWNIYFFIGIKAHVFGILACTEDKPCGLHYYRMLRPLGSHCWNSWTTCCEPSNKSLLSMISFPLENHDNYRGFLYYFFKSKAKQNKKNKMEWLKHKNRFALNWK